MKRKLFPYKYVLVFFTAIIAALSIHWIDKAPVLKNGTYQFNILRPDGKQIVFNTLVKDSLGEKIMYVINGSERLLVDSIVYSNDSVIIQLPFFESGFRAIINDNGNIEGVWIKNYGSREQTLPFTAIFNKKERFPVTTPPSFNITGRWAVNFIRANGRVSQSIGEFKQNGSNFTGTFLFPSGDYRFLEGVVSGDSLYLSGFDGGHAFLFTARIDDSNNISGGKFYSGKQDVQTWNAVKNNEASLPETASSVEVKPGAGKLNFSFPDVDGKMISINDERFKNKVVVIQILGSWCPNCMDETRFLSENYETYHDKGVEFIGIAYERTTDFEKSKKSLQPFIKRFDIQYPILIPPVAVSDTLRTEKTLPQIEKIKAFPTTLLIGKNGEIRKIHSGFDGPATGIHYHQFKKDFDETINELLLEK